MEMLLYSTSKLLLCQKLHSLLLLPHLHHCYLSTSCRRLVILLQPTDENLLESHFKAIFFFLFSVPYSSFLVDLNLQLIAELVGTYYLIFAGCAAIAVNAQHNNVVTLVGIAVVWGLVVMVLVYSLGHISAHFNPAVTIALASCKRFPLYQLPAYLTVQVIGSTLASATLRLLFDLNNDVCSKKHDVFLGSTPSGTDLQAFGMEFIITGFLMIVVCAVTTSKRTVSDQQPKTLHTFLDQVLNLNII